MKSYRVTLTEQQASVENVGEAGRIMLPESDLAIALACRSVGCENAGIRIVTFNDDGSVGVVNG